MADDSLNIKINVSEDTGEIDATVAKFATLKSGIADANAAHATGAESAAKHAAAEGILGESIGKVESATNSAARVFSTLGLNTAEATERVEGLAEALDALGKAAPELLAIGAAVLVVAEAFNVLKDGVDEATKAQAAMASLGQTITNQGGNWKDAQEGVERFLDAIEHATTYSRGEALSALESLTAAGMSLADAEKVVAIATDVATASHRSLIDVTNLIKEAEAGRGRGLVELDEKLKPLIDSHAHLSVVLNQLASDMRDQAAAALETNAGKAQLLRNELDHLAEELGDTLLPAINVGIEVILEFAQGMEDHLPQVEAFFSGVIAGAERAGNVLLEFGKLTADVGKTIAAGLAMNPAGAVSGGTAAAGDFNALLHPGSGPDLINDAIKKVNDDFEKRLAAAKKTLDAYRAQPLQNDPVLGEPRKGEDKDFDFTPATAANFDKDADKDAQQALEDSLKSLTEGDRVFEDAVKSATTAQQKQTAEWNLAQRQSDDAQAALGLLTAALAKDRTELEALNAALPGQKAGYVEAEAAYNAFGAAIGKSPTKDESNHLRDLKTAMDDAKTAVETTSSSIDKLSGYIRTDTAAFDEAQSKVKTYANSMAALALAENAYTVKTMEGLADQMAAENKAHAEEDARRAVSIENLQTENALYGLSIQQQLAYYQLRYANEVAAGTQYSDEAKSDFDKIVQLEGDEYKQRLDQQKAFLEELQSGESTVLDGIIQKHESLKDTLKSIWSEIVTDFEKSIETMILKGSLLSGLNRELASFLNIGGGGSASAGGIGAAASGASSNGIFGAILGPQGASQVAASLPTNAGTTGMLFGSQAASTLGTDINSASPGALANDSPMAGVSAAQWKAATSPTSGLSTGLGDALAGLGIGGVVSSLDGGNSTYGSIGGALGGIAAAVTKANPLAGLGLELGGALLGSLFSGGQPTPAKDPDEFESQTGYGQDVADLQFGQSNANGTYYYPDSAIAQFVAKMGVQSGTITGGANQGMQSVNSNGTIASSGGIDAAEMWLAANKSDTAAQLEAMGVSPAQYASWVSLLGSSATGSGQYTHYDNNVGDIEVTGATTGGNTKSTTAALSAALNAIITASGTAGSSAIPTFSVTRSYASPGKITGLQSDGTYTPTAADLLGVGSSTSSGAYASSSGSASAGSTTGDRSNAQVSVVINGNVVGPGGMESIAQEIGIALNRFKGGLVPGAGSGASGRMQRFTGGS